MTTRRAAKKQRIETGPLLGPVHLPSEVIGNNLLRCLGLRSLLLLSTCNSAFQREVFRKQIGEDDECASIWQTIDFGSVPPEMAAKLTDDQLQKLLLKCHAKEVTAILKLTGCVGLKGTGLEPLRGSIVLREADLRAFRDHEEEFVSITGYANSDNSDSDDSDMYTDDNDDARLGDSVMRDPEDELVTISGAGSDAVNGIYRRTAEICYGLPVYKKKGKWRGHSCSFSLFRCRLSNMNMSWYISYVPKGVKPGTTKDVDFYKADPMTGIYFDVPPESGWRRCSEGVDPPPNLRRHGRDILETTFVFNLLSSMPPIAPVPASFGNRHLGLALVKFTVRNPGVRNLFDRFKAETGDWLRKFLGAREVACIRDRTHCDHCHTAIADRWPGEAADNLGWVTCKNYCERCKKVSCCGVQAAKESECANVHHCAFCMLQCCAYEEKCKSAVDIFECNECGVEGCEECVDWRFCNTCSSMYCGRDGKCEQQGIFCIYCIAPICDGCVDGPIVTGNDDVARALCKECKDRGRPFDRSAIKYVS